MKYTNVALKEKIREMYPDIEKHKVSVGLTFSEEKNAYLLKFKRGKQELVTQIDKSDADDCMNNIRCVAIHHDLPIPKQQCPIAKPRNCCHVMGNKQNCSALLSNTAHFVKAFTLELCIPYR